MGAGSNNVNVNAVETCIRCGECGKGCDDMSLYLQALALQARSHILSCDEACCGPHSRMTERVQGHV